MAEIRHKTTGVVMTVDDAIAAVLTTIEYEPADAAAKRGAKKTDGE